MMAFFLLIVAYLIGSIPFGLIIGSKFYNVNIAERGSGNIGATNVFRVLGPKAGTVVLSADFFKGFLAVYIVKALATPALNVSLLEVLAAVFVVLGHSMSIFLGFSGGKGVATAAGSLLAIMPKIFILLALVWISLIVFTRYVSLASMLAAIVFPIFAVFFNHNQYRIILSFVICLIILVKHRSNLVRLIQGTENKFSIGSK